MIKVDKNETSFKGTLPELKADLTLIIKKLHENANLDKEEILRIVDIAFMSEEELDNEIEKTIKEHMSLASVIESLEELLKEVKGNE